MSKFLSSIQEECFEIATPSMDVNEKIRIAIRSKRIAELEEILRDAFGSIMLQNRYHSLNWHHYASLYGSVDCLKWFIERKQMNVNAKVGKPGMARIITPDNSGKFLVTGDTCLHIAAREGHLKIVRYLLSRKLKRLNVHIENERKLTSDKVKSQNRTELITLLIKNRRLEDTISKLPTYREYQSLLVLKAKFFKLLPEIQKMKRTSVLADTVKNQKKNNLSDGGAALVESLRILFKPKSCIEDLIKAGREGPTERKCRALKEVLDKSDEILKSKEYKNLLEVFGFSESEEPKYKKEDIEISKKKLQEIMDLEESRIRNTENIKSNYETFRSLWKEVVNIYREADHKKKEASKARENAKFTELMNTNLDEFEDSLEHKKEESESESHNGGVNEMDFFEVFYKKKRELENLKREILECTPCFEKDYRETLAKINVGLLQLNNLPKSDDELRIGKKQSPIVQKYEKDVILNCQNNTEKKGVLTFRGLSDYFNISEIIYEKSKVQNAVIKKHFTANLKGDERPFLCDERKEKRVKCITFLLSEKEEMEFSEITKFLEMNSLRINCFFEIVLGTEKHICFEMEIEKPKIELEEEDDNINTNKDILQEDDGEGSDDSDGFDSDNES